MTWEVIAAVTCCWHGRRRSGQPLVTTYRGDLVTTPTPLAADPPATDLLRRILRIDSWSTAAFGVVLLAGGGPLSEPLDLPTEWSIPFGVAMLGGAAALGLIAGYPRIRSRHAAAVAAGNAVSGVVLVVLAVTDLLPLTGLGVAFVLVGALVVASYAALEFVGLRRLQSAGEPQARRTAEEATCA
jgi:hypothetical protein